MSKKLWLIWKQPKTRQRYKIGELKYDGKEYSFKYTNPELCDAKKVGFICFPGFDDLSKHYKSTELFNNIDTRLPNVVRNDYLEILNSYTLDVDSSKIEILEATKGRLVTDNYEFVPKFDVHKVVFDIAGTRYCKDIEKCRDLIKLNDSLFLESDSNNMYDQNAIKIYIIKNNQKYYLGYVPRYYSKEMKKLLDENIQYSAMVQNINFESTFYDEDVSVVVKLIFK